MPENQSPTKTVTIYGSSDDLIEIDGAIYEEFNPRDPDEWTYLAFSEGTVLQIRYDRDGMWRIAPVVHGSAAWEIKQATNEETDYTDRATLTGDVRWVVQGSRFEKATR